MEIIITGRFPDHHFLVNINTWVGADNPKIFGSCLHSVKSVPLCPLSIDGLCCYTSPLPICLHSPPSLPPSSSLSSVPSNPLLLPLLLLALTPGLPQDLWMLTFNVPRGKLLLTTSSRKSCFYNSLLTHRERVCVWFWNLIIKPSSVAGRWIGWNLTSIILDLW